MFIGQNSGIILDVLFSSWKHIRVRVPTCQVDCPVLVRKELIGVLHERRRPSEHVPRTLQGVTNFGIVDTLRDVTSTIWMDLGFTKKDYSRQWHHRFEALPCFFNMWVRLKVVDLYIYIVPTSVRFEGWNSFLETTINLSTCWFPLIFSSTLWLFNVAPI